MRNIRELEEAIIQEARYLVEEGTDEEGWIDTTLYDLRELLNQLDRMEEMA